MKHFLDSLAVWSRVKDLESLADIGSGAGFPGLPLKLALPHLHLTLIEPTAKKTAFLHFIMAHLGLTDVEVRQVHLTAAAAQGWGPSFQGVITRATFTLAHYMQIGAPLVKAGGRLLAMKGPPPGSSPMAGGGGPGGPIPSPASGKMGLQPALDPRKAAAGKLDKAGSKTVISQVKRLGARPPRKESAKNSKII